jgi:hypothetical protein
MAKIQLLIFTKILNSMVIFAPGSSLIVQDAVDHSNTGQAESEALQSQIDGMAIVEQRGVLGQVCPAIVQKVSKKINQIKGTREDSRG